MGVSVGTIFKWYKPDGEDICLETCEDGQCVGMVTECHEPDKGDVPRVSVKWWEMCNFHLEACEMETGPYDLSYIWQIGQFY